MRAKRIAWGIAGTLLSGYLGVCGYLFVKQRQVIYYPTKALYSNPAAPEYRIPYEDVAIPIGNQTLTGWWLPAPTPSEPLDGLPGEPQRILSRPKVLLYLCGVGPNMGAPNYLTRIKALRQLGFAVLIFDYRGYGRSEGAFPSESQIYADADAAWDYLTHTRQIAPADIVIYGESLGGAVAIELAQRQPGIHGLIVQSSFTRMQDVIVRRGEWYGHMPIGLLLTEKFDSISKVKTLKMPLLFIHGTDDGIVPVDMSQTLYDQAPEPKMLWVVKGGTHVRIYNPRQSYLKAIAQFLTGIGPATPIGFSPHRTTIEQSN
jgi:uncharacterized protein